MTDHGARPEYSLSRILILLLALLPALTVQAAPEKGADIDRIRATFARLFPGMKGVEIRETAMPGMYEVIVPGGDVLYASGDGQHFMIGDLYQVKGERLVNLTEVRDERERRQALAELPAEQFITFPAQNQKTAIHVFTDVDCTYCRKMHREINQLNALGITVHYMAFPRSGIGTSSFQKAETAWCAKDPQQTLTDLKARKPVPMASCNPNPVAAQYMLAQKLGVRGTPAIVLESGKLLPGYLPAEDLAKAIGLR